MATWETVLIAVGERAWLLVLVAIALAVLAHPVRTVGRCLSTEIWDRYLGWKHIPDDERLRLIIRGAELEVGQASAQEHVADRRDG